MALRALQGPAGGAAPVGGSGTTNYIPRWNPGPSTLGDSIIIQGSTANAVGIGNAPTTDLAGYKALEVGGLGSGFVNADNDLWITANAKHSGGGWKYAVTASTPSNSIRANAGAIIFNRAIAGTASSPITWLESARIDSSGTLAFGKSVYASPTSEDFYRIKLEDTGGVANDVGIGQPASGSLAFNWNSSGSLIFYQANAATPERMRIDSSGNLILNTANTSATIQAAGSQQGLKLPATPGNADAQTLDCYQENPLATTSGNGWTPTLSAAATWGGTQPTVDYARYIRIGSMVFCEVRLSGAALTATYGTTTISQPPVTINATAVESAVPVSTAAGSGVGVCTSTSVFLPTLGATTAMRLSWFYFTTS